MRASFSLNKKDDISIVICGAAGQGIKTVEHLLTRVMKSTGYNVFAMREYMSRVRGGVNSTEIRVATKRVAAFVNRIDILIPLSKEAIPHLQSRITEDTIIIGEKENISNACDCSSYKTLELDLNKITCDCLGLKTLEIPFVRLAEEIGGQIFLNILASGMICGLLNVEINLIEDYIKKRFAKKSDQIINNNFKAVQKGYEIAKELIKSGILTIEIEKNQNITNELLLDGTEAIGMGAIAGGCNFISGYPMSPSTGVLTFLANNSEQFGIVWEQIEDEIAAINSVIGSWYAGGRGMGTTSGGGLALMSEGMSLAGVTETPVVLHLAQRPGPATGLPTRTIQSDLQLALYCGHGFFPRIILSPGKMEDAFYLAQKAFNLADKYQVPVFILTDQYLINSYYNIPKLDMSNVFIEKHIVKTDENYKRYKLTEDGISPRGIPGYGNGLIAIDSHEHDEEGHISEDLEYIRIEMVKKRLKKLDLIRQAVIPPDLIGLNNYKILVIGWGSTFYAIKEALDILNNKDIAFLHFKQVYPLYPKIADYLEKAEITIMIENNATAQFAKLIRQETGIQIQNNILKYNGLPFAVEEIVKELKQILNL